MSADMTVERVSHANGSHIVPPLDQSWDDLTKLRWQAAVVACDTGLRVSVRAGGSQRKRFGRWQEIPGTYSFTVGGSGIGSFRFGSGWTFLTGVSVGAQAMQERSS